MITPKFYGTIQNKKLVLNPTDQQYFDAHLLQFKDEDEIEMQVKKKKKLRTIGAPGEETNFNGYYWAVIVREVADHIGEMNQNIVHAWIQENVGNIQGMPDGKTVAKGTSDMSGGEFSDYCSRARMWANQELGMYLPEPHEAGWE